MARGKVIWLTGMSGAGKTTIASSASLILGEMGISVHQIDGDDVRKSYGRKLGFSRADIFRNNQTVVQLADAARKISDLVLITVIGPLNAGRLLAREAFAPKFSEVYVSAKLDTLHNRDTKGLYSQAACGEINDLIGVGNGVTYEPPLDPGLLIDTDLESVHDSVEQFVKFVNDFCNKE
jgi:adenylyl-sulfate kinase